MKNPEGNLEVRNGVGMDPELAALLGNFAYEFTRQGTQRRNTKFGPQRTATHDVSEGTIVVSSYSPDGTSLLSDELSHHYGFDPSGGSISGHVLFSRETTDGASFEGQLFIVDNGRCLSVLEMEVDSVSALKSRAASGPCFELADAMGFGRTWTEFMYGAFGAERASVEPDPPYIWKTTLMPDNRIGDRILATLESLKTSP